MSTKFTNLIFEKLNGYSIHYSNQFNSALDLKNIAIKLLDLKEHGFLLDHPLLETILSQKNDTDVNRIFDDIFSLYNLLPDVNHGKTLFNNFSHVYDENNQFDIAVVQLFHYFTGMVDDQADIVKEDMPKDNIVYKQLKIVSSADIHKLVVNLLTSNVTLSESDHEAVLILFDQLSNEELEHIFDESTITLKTLLVEVTIYAYNRGIIINNLKTTTDVLRLISLMSNSEFNQKFILYKEFSDDEINMIYQLLDHIVQKDLNSSVDDFLRYSKPWKRFFKIVQKKVHIDQYKDLNQAVHLLFNKKGYITKQGEINNAYLSFLNDKSDRSLTTLLSLYKQRSGELARNLLSLLNATSNYEQFMLVLETFLNQSDKINNRVLFQIKDRVENLNNRLVHVKGAAVLLDETLTFTNEEQKIINYTVSLSIVKNLSQKDVLNSVYFEDEEQYKNIALTTSERDANHLDHPMTTGSRIDINDNVDVLRLFTHWYNYDNQRVDIDLSAVFLTEDFKISNRVGWNSSFNVQEKGVPNTKFSGDIINPDENYGATEYIDIDLSQEIDYKKTRYIMIMNNSFSGQSFKDIPSVTSGVMNLTKEQSNTDKYKKFDPKFVLKSFDLSQNTKSNIALAFDLKEKVLIWLDVDTSVRKIASSSFDNDKYYEVLLNKNYISVYDLVKYNVLSRNSTVLSTEQFNALEDEDQEKVIVFKKIDQNNSLQLAYINSELI